MHFVDGENWRNDEVTIRLTDDSLNGEVVYNETTTAVPLPYRMSMKGGRKKG